MTVSEHSSTASQEPMAYVSHRACGCLSMAAVDSEVNRRLAASEVAKAIRLGETVSRVTVEAVRSMPFRCVAHEAEATKKRTLASAKKQRQLL